MRVNVVIVLVALLFQPAISTCQDTHTVQGAAQFRWPQSSPSAVESNKLPIHAVENFINLLRSRVAGFGSTQCSSFRFAPLEKAKFYLVVSCGGRIESDIDIVAPEEHSYQFTEIQSDLPLPLPMTLVDMDGDGVDELMTGIWPAGYMGADTPPIYWYTLWRFQAGEAVDVSTHFPGFYRNFALVQADYLGGLLEKLQPVNPKDVHVPLAEIHYIRLRFERTVLGNKNAGLDQALQWAESKDPSIQVLGMSSLAEIPAKAAENELVKLSRLQGTRDLATAFLTKRAKLLRKNE